MSYQLLVYSSYKTMEMKKEFFFFFHFSQIFIFIVLINLDAQIWEAKTWYIIVYCGLNQPMQDLFYRK